MAGILCFADFDRELYRFISEQKVHKFRACKAIDRVLVIVEAGYGACKSAG
jgi:hypothetical protein